MLGVVEKELFCFLVASSWVIGVESIETPDKLCRFSDGITDILHRHTR